MQFIDLKKQYDRISPFVEKRIKGVLDSTKFIMGPDVDDLESKLSRYVNRKYCISCSSGTDALLMSLMAIEVGEGDLVFTTPFTYVATAEVISLLKATPVFVDIDPNTFNIDPDKLEETIKYYKKTSKMNLKAIIPVDIFGLLADYERINSIAKEYNLEVIEDAAQSFGAEFKGQKSCSYGNFSTTSFFPAKPLGCYGDGGAIFTDNKKMVEILKSIRIHGTGSDKYDNVRIGINGRLDTIQASILIEKLKIFDEEFESRQNIGKLYTKYLSDKVEVPYIPDGHKSAWALYSVLADNNNHRLELMERLSELKIPAVVYYRKPLHLQKAFSYLGYKKGDFEVSEEISSRIFSLPMHPYLEESDIIKVSNCL